VLFGLAHLGFRQFPNWRFAVVAGVAGVFYGLAYRRGGGIRSAMVAHAFTVTAWKTLFR
jgi:membrane protease YdiL (CAAX protease family)